MGLSDDITKVKSDPHLIQHAPTALMRHWSHFIVGKQIRSKAAQLDTSDLSREHYAWQSMTTDFNWNIFCIQETNLINFVKTHSSVYHHIAVEVGAASDVFLKHIDANTKKGVNVLDECLDQLNRQGIIGIKSIDERIPLEDNESDLTICFETLEHVHNPVLFLNELSRITSNKPLLSIPWVQKTNIRSRWHGADTAGETPDAEFHIFEFSEDD